MPDLRPRLPGPGAAGGAGRRAPSVTVREQKRSGTCTVSVAAGSSAAAPRDRPTWAMPGARGVSWVSGGSHTAALWRAEGFEQRPALPERGQAAEQGSALSLSCRCSTKKSGLRWAPLGQLTWRRHRARLERASPIDLLSCRYTSLIGTT